MRILNYRILLKKEPDGGYTVTVCRNPERVQAGIKKKEIKDLL